MLLIWDAGRRGITVQDIQDIFRRRTDEPVRSAQAIGALLSRIHRKGYVRIEVGGPTATTYYYYAVKPYDAALTQKIEHFLDSVIADDPQGLEILAEAVRKRSLKAVAPTNRR